MATLKGSKLFKTFLISLIILVLSAVFHQQITRVFEPLFGGRTPCAADNLTGTDLSIRGFGPNCTNTNTAAELTLLVIFALSLVVAIVSGVVLVWTKIRQRSKRH